MKRLLPLVLLAVIAVPVDARAAGACAVSPEVPACRFEALADMSFSFAVTGKVVVQVSRGSDIVSIRCMTGPEVGNVGLGGARASYDVYVGALTETTVAFVGGAGDTPGTSTGSGGPSPC